MPIILDYINDHFLFQHFAMNLIACGSDLTLNFNWIHMNTTNSVGNLTDWMY